MLHGDTIACRGREHAAEMSRHPEMHASLILTGRRRSSRQRPKSISHRAPMIFDAVCRSAGDQVTLINVRFGHQTTLATYLIRRYRLARAFHDSHQHRGYAAMMFSAVAKPICRRRASMSSAYRPQHRAAYRFLLCRRAVLCTPAYRAVQF